MNDAIDEKYLFLMEEVVRYSKIIISVAKCPTRGSARYCPHGNIPFYPSHAWWCDKCFGNLENAIGNLDIYKENIKNNDLIIDDDNNCEMS